MSIKLPKITSQSYVETLHQAADEIKLRAEEIIGDIDGQQGITVTIHLNSNEIATIDVLKTYISGWKQRKMNDAGEIEEELNNDKNRNVNKS